MIGQPPGLPPHEFKIVALHSTQSGDCDIEQAFNALSMEGWTLCAVDSGVAVWGRSLIKLEPGQVALTCGQCLKFNPGNNQCEKFNFTTGPDSPVCGKEEINGRE